MSENPQIERRSFLALSSLTLAGVAIGGPTAHAGPGRPRSVGRHTPPYFAALQGQRQESDPRLTWSQLPPGMSGYSEHTWFHPTDPDTIYVTPDGFMAYRSTDNAASWHPMQDHDGDGREVTRVNWMDFSRQDENIGYAVNREGLWKTTDKGASWQTQPEWVWFSDCSTFGGPLLEGCLAEEGDPGEPSIWAGTLSAVTVDPTDDDIIYVGSGDFWNDKSNRHTVNHRRGNLPDPGLFWRTNTGKIWRSADGGGTWQLINNGIEPAAEIGKIIVDPTDPSTLFAATTYGVYRSVDSGTTWTPQNSGFDTGIARDLVLHHDADTGTVTLFALDQVEWEPDGSGSILSKGGVFKSTDRAATWISITSNLPLDLDALPAMHNPSQVVHQRYYVALSRWFEISRADAEQQFPVLPHDALQSFSRIVVDPNDADKIYVSHNAQHCVSFKPGDVWTTDDGGQSWYVAARFTNGWQVDADYWAARGNPTDVNMEYGHQGISIVNGRYDQYGVSTLSINSRGDVCIWHFQQLLRSTDGGQSWVQVDEVETEPGSGNWVSRGNSNVHGRGVYVDSRTPDQVYAIGLEHGPWRTTDDGWMVAPDAQAADELGRTERAGQSASRDVCAIAVHPADVNTIYTLIEKGRGVGTVQRSTDGGATWSTWSTPFPNVSRLHQFSLIIDSVQPDNMYFCVPAKVINVSGAVDPAVQKGVWKSTDGGLTWNLKNIGLPAGSSVNHLSFDPHDSMTLYAAVLEHEGTCGGLFTTSDGGNRWRKLPTPGIEQVNHVHLQQNGSGRRIFISTGTDTGESSEGGLLVSDDGGRRWSRIFHLPFVVRSATAPYDSNRILVAAGSSKAIGRLNPGVYLSNDSGSNWAKVNRGLIQPGWVYDVAFDVADPNVFWCSLARGGAYKGRWAG